MLKEIVSSLRKFRDNIYHFFHHRQNAAMDLVGRPKRYGKKHNLSDEKTWELSDEQVEFEIEGKNGEKLKIRIEG